MELKGVVEAENGAPGSTSSEVEPLVSATVVFTTVGAAAGGTGTETWVAHLGQVT